MAVSRRNFLHVMRDRITSWVGHSVNRGIFSAALTVSGITLLVKIGSALKEILVARQFGTGDDLDAFLIAFLIPSLCINVIAASLASVAVPAFLQIKVRDGKAAAQHFFSNIHAWCIGLLVLISLALSLSGPFLLSLLTSSFSSEKYQLTRTLYFILLPILTVSGLSTLWGGILNAGERFGQVAWAQILTPMTTIIVLLAFGISWGIFALAIGTIAGFTFEAAILAKLLKGYGFTLLPRWGGWTPALLQVRKEYIPMLVGALLMSGMTAVDQAMAATLAPGSVAALNYGNRIVAMILSLMAGLWIVVLTYFSKMAAEKDWTGIRHTLNTYSRLVFAVGIPLVLLLVLFSKPIVSILFERGAFSAQDTSLVSNIQIYYFLQIPFYVLVLLMMRLISSLKANRWLMLVSSINFILNVVLNYVLMHWMGVAGIALSTTIVYVISFFCFWFIIRRLLPMQITEKQ